MHASETAVGKPATESSPLVDADVERAAASPPSDEHPWGGCRRIWSAFDVRTTLQSIWFRKRDSGRSFGELDGLRALAFVWVFVFHVQLNELGLLHLPRALKSLTIQGGDGGVALFLVLSGFLLAHIMSGLLARQPSGVSAYGRFVYRRFARIYPALIACVFFSVGTYSEMTGFGWWSACDQAHARLPGVFAFIQAGGLGSVMLSTGLLTGNSFVWACRVADPSWTVSVEFQFYLLLPLLVVAYRWNRWLGAWLALAAFTLSVAYRSSWTIRDVPAPLLDDGGVDAARSVKWLLSEYVSGVIAYMVVSDRGLGWVGGGAEAGDSPGAGAAPLPGAASKGALAAALGKEQQSSQQPPASTPPAGPPSWCIPCTSIPCTDTMCLLLVQLLWLISLTAYLCLVMTDAVNKEEEYFPMIHWDNRHSYANVLLAVSAALLIVSSCAPPVMPAAGERRDGHSKAAADHATRLDYITWVVGSPVRWTCAALRSPVLFPVASVSYTAYLLQPLFFSGKLILQHGGGELDGFLCLGALCACLGFGLLASLLVERPCMKLLHMVDPFSAQGRR